MSVGEEEIKNYNTYLQQMEKSLDEKLFFIDYFRAANITQLVDFGCADGALIAAIAGNFPTCEIIGYDLDPIMIQTAEARGLPANVTFVSDLAQIEVRPGSAVLLSSVLHEIYSYADNIPSILEFINRFDHIFIRDMRYMLGGDITTGITTNINQVDLVRANAQESLLRDFERIWGSISNRKQMVHFMLKHRYKSNWDREVKENYFATDWDELFDSLDHRIIYQENYIPVAVQQILSDDFGICLQDYTHTRLILRKF